MLCTCPDCGSKYRIKDGATDVARKFRCQKCDKIVIIPAQQKAETEKIHCLLHNGVPFILSPEQTAQIGRGKDCHLWIDDPRASRHHAEVAWNGKEYVILDLESGNGVFLDNEPIVAAPLHDAAKIYIAGSILSYRIVDDLRELRNSVRIQRRSRWKDETSILPAIDSNVPEDFKGNLDSIHFGEICQLMRLSNTTGRISLLSPDRKKADVYFQRGQAMRAEFDALEGEEAVFALFKLKKGLFGFKKEPFENEPNISCSTDALLLEAARQMDEAG